MHHLQRHNPSTSMATFGAAAGGVLGGLAAAFIGGLIAAAVYRARTGEEAAGLGAPYQRIWHLLTGAGVFAGSTYGAYLGAAPYQRGRAVTGAMIGSGLVIIPNVIINPAGHASGLWGLLGGSAAAGVGTAVGAATAAPQLVPRSVS